MTTTRAAEDTDTASIRATEAQRCAAIKNRDRQALSDTLSDDLSYMHSTGLREGKEDFIMTTTGGTPRAIERGEIDVLLFGDVAMVTGDYEVRIEPDSAFPEGRRVAASGLQVWKREGDQWRLFAHQGTAKPEATEGNS